MLEKDAMLKEVAQYGRLAVLGAAVSGPGLARVLSAQRQIGPPCGRKCSSPLPGSRSTCVIASWSCSTLAAIGLGLTRAHIPGSHFVRLDEFVEQRKNSLNELPPVSDLQAIFESLGVGDQSRVVLTGDAQGMLAARVYFTLDYLGHGDNAALLDGGQERWLAESRTVSKEEARPTHAHFTPHVQPEIVISTARMLQLGRRTNDGSPEYALLDARPVAEYEGVVKSEAVPKAGHIVGSRASIGKS